MGGQQPPKKGIRRVGGRTRRVDVIVHHTRVNRPAAEVAHAIDGDADRSRATGRPLSQRMASPFLASRRRGAHTRQRQLQPTVDTRRGETHVRATRTPPPIRR